jgi:hypothetical protein
MTTSSYVFDKTLYATDFTASCASCWGNIYTYDFKIDVSGNVFVKWGQADFRESQPKATDDMYSIIDNIKVPPHIIELYEHLSSQIDQGPGNGACRLDKIRMLFETVNHLKSSMGKEHNENAALKRRIAEFEATEGMLRKQIEEIQVKSQMEAKIASERELLSKALNLELLDRIDITKQLPEMASSRYQYIGTNEWDNPF